MAQIRFRSVTVELRRRAEADADIVQQRRLAQETKVRTLSRIAFDVAPGNFRRLARHECRVQHEELEGRTRRIVMTCEDLEGIQ